MMKKSLLMIGLSLAVLCSCSKSDELNPQNTPVETAQDAELETKAEQITLTVRMTIGSDSAFGTIDKDLATYGIERITIYFVDIYVNFGSGYEYSTLPQGLDFIQAESPYSETAPFRFVSQTYFAQNQTRIEMGRYSSYTADQFKVVVQGIGNYDYPRR